MWTKGILEITTSRGWEKFWKLLCVYLTATYYSHLHCILIRMGKVTEQKEGMVFCQASGVRKIPQLRTDTLHCCSLGWNAHIHTDELQHKYQHVKMFLKNVHEEKKTAVRLLTAGTFSLLKMSVMRAQLLSKCPLFGWHLVGTCGGGGPAMEQTPHWWHGGEKQVR